MNSAAELATPLIRRYRDTDAGATLAIFLAAITETASADYSPEQLQAWARPDRRDVRDWHAARSSRHTLVVTLGDDVAGFSDLSDAGYIDMMFVSPKHARRGVARTLLAEIERRARDRGVDRLWADVSITARPFFERYGFDVIAEQHPVTAGVRMTNFRMEKGLANSSV